jgi:hypothetical protein
VWRKDRLGDKPMGVVVETVLVSEMGFFVFFLWGRRKPA